VLLLADTASRKLWTGLIDDLTSTPLHGPGLGLS
jgi:hypothetical protein